MLGFEQPPLSLLREQPPGCIQGHGEGATQVLVECTGLLERWILLPLNP